MSTITPAEAYDRLVARGHDATDVGHYLFALAANREDRGLNPDAVTLAECDGIEDDLNAGHGCPLHPAARIEREWASTGFAGGQMYFTEWSCGCTDVDDADDVAAAR